MNTVFVVRCDGRREYLPQSLASAQENLKGNFDRMFIIDDSGDADYAQWLETTFPAFEQVHHPQRLGMAAGVRTSLETVLDTSASYIFATEDDFVFLRPTNIAKMARLLHCEPHLAQLVLNKEASGVDIAGTIQRAPEEYDDHECPSGNWVEHRIDGDALHVFSFNPSLIRREAIEIAAANASDTLEQGVTDALLAADYRFAYYGKRDDAPRVRHIGYMRSAGYRW